MCSSRQKVKNSHQIKVLGRHLGTCMKGHEDDHECRFGSKADVCAAINYVRFFERATHDKLAESTTHSRQ
jgi:hypothetical protein